MNPIVVFLIFIALGAIAAPLITALLATAAGLLADFIRAGQQIGGAVGPSDLATGIAVLLLAYALALGVLLAVHKVAGYFRPRHRR